MKVEEGRTFIGRFRLRTDLLQSLTDFCRDENIRLGVFSVIGALSNVKLGYYDQTAKQYKDPISIDKKVEIVSCNGNISLKENHIFLHAHIAVADESGQCFGGHLLQGSNIFAAEYYIKELAGADMQRKLDYETGLSLW